jgi:hypothetical protein
MIEHVEKFCPQLQPGAILDGEAPEYREITDLVAGAVLSIAGYNAKRSRRRVRVSAGIKEDARDAGRGIGIANQVRTLLPVGVGDTIVVQHCERISRRSRGGANIRASTIKLCFRTA